MKTRRGATGAYTALANILCACGICYCTIGRREEGVTMRGELDELQWRLDTNFPSLARLVEIDTPILFFGLFPRRLFNESLEGNFSCSKYSVQSFLRRESNISTRAQQCPL